MMTRALLKFTLPAILLLTLAAALPRAQMADNSRLRAFLLAENCRPPCWQGLRPGVTSDTNLLDQLAAHPWVAQVDAREYDGFSGFVTWLWSGEQPAWVGIPGADYIFLEQNTVSQINLWTSLRYGDIWQVLGRPDWVNQFQADGMVRLNIAYRQPGLLVLLDIPCSAGVSGLWQAQAALIWPIFVSERGQFMHPTPARLSTCERR